MTTEEIDTMARKSLEPTDWRIPHYVQGKELSAVVRRANAYSRVIEWLEQHGHAKTDKRMLQWRH